ncbi:MAG: ABC transporter permease subunit [Methanomicrobiaceae archaeon]|uniref:Abc transporter permease protein n=1 Tax=hydrocarbon metagenome TaxID=938273 RepID=A0A0W8FH29_9ZZZZ|nr:ABC transporter permease subunit [Methanomicrobiaceae archaeon]MDD5420023.1 ABC transporter permease subunit [Methanomicrobiaceae archaeon]
MNRRIVWTVAEKDLREVRRNRIAVFGAVILSVVFAVALPLFITQMPAIAAGTPDEPTFEEVASIIPPELLDLMEQLDPAQLPIVLFLGYLFAPLFLVLPLMLASIIASEAFVGEKERKTLEALVYTPATDLELFAGKVLASAAPAVAYAWANFAIYAVVVNVAGWPIMGEIWFPTGVWWVLMLWVTPAVATLGVSATVLISSRVNTFMEAYQASGALVLLILFLLLGQIFGIIFLSPLVLFLIGAAFFAVDALLIRFGVKIFARSELIARI